MLKESLGLADWLLCPKDEHFLVDAVIAKLRQMVRDIWPNADVVLFGSRKTQLHLPTSDIDVSIIGINEDDLHEGVNPYYKLAGYLEKEGFCEKQKVVSSAAVPIIKLTESKFKYKIDVALGVTDGRDNTQLMLTYIQKYPVLASIVVIVKQFLRQRKLNKPFTGGMGSYLLTVLTIFFLKEHKSSTFAKDELRTLLCDFFKFYGIEFDRLAHGISIERGFYKLEQYEEVYNNNNLSVEDPFRNDNDIGQKCFKFRDIRLEFGTAYVKLRNGDDLSKIITLDKKLIDRRSAIAAYLVQCYKPLTDLIPAKEQTPSPESKKRKSTDVDISTKPKKPRKDRYNANVMY